MFSLASSAFLSANILHPRFWRSFNPPLGWPIGQWSQKDLWHPPSLVPPSLPPLSLSPSHLTLMPLLPPSRPLSQYAKARGWRDAICHSTKIVSVLASDPYPLLLIHTPSCLTLPHLHLSLTSFICPSQTLVHPSLPPLSSLPHPPSLTSLILLVSPPSFAPSVSPPPCFPASLTIHSSAYLPSQQSLPPPCCSLSALCPPSPLPPLLSHHLTFTL